MTEIFDKDFERYESGDRDFSRCRTCESFYIESCSETIGFCDVEKEFLSEDEFNEVNEGMSSCYDYQATELY